MLIASPGRQHFYVEPLLSEGGCFVDVDCIYVLRNGNRTEWSTIQSHWASDLKLRAQLLLNCATRSPITN